MGGCEAHLKRTTCEALLLLKMCTQFNLREAPFGVVTKAEVKRSVRSSWDVLSMNRCKSEKKKEPVVPRRRRTGNLTAVAGSKPAADAKFATKMEISGMIGGKMNAVYNKYFKHDDRQCNAQNPSGGSIPI